jgi:GNAT superfamily N-acetyltransferase
MDAEPGVKPSAADLDVFLVARRDGVAIGCGALRRLDETTFELKRMFVVVGERGSGVAKTLLDALEAEARERGATRMLLETGTEQHEAIRFYEREGYARCDCWGAYASSPVSLCYGREL